MNKKNNRVGLINVLIILLSLIAAFALWLYISVDEYVPESEEGMTEVTALVNEAEVV